MPHLLPSEQRRQRVAILGSTGSIGQSSLKVAADLIDRIEVVALAAARSSSLFAEQIKLWKPQYAALTDPNAAAEARSILGPNFSIEEGEDSLCTAATLPEVDIVLIAIVGTAGLRPALAAINAGKHIAVASKEILVMAGSVVMEAARRKGVNVLPVDSEHNAIFQCLEGHKSSDVSRLILTASGGPFRNTPSKDLLKVTPTQALKHPTWDMGKKISIDSATLFNKGLEMIEARWLFDVPMQSVDVVIHPQSIIHSMVEFCDSSILAQLSTTDMCFPIQYALTWPARIPNRLPPIDFPTLARLEFEAPRYTDFPALNLARAAGNTGGTLPAVLNAANEIAVATFLSGKCTFPHIWQCVESVMDIHVTQQTNDLLMLIDADQWARRSATNWLASKTC